MKESFSHNATGRAVSLGIRANFYPPKYWSEEQPTGTRTHLIFSPSCNLRCEFCYYSEAWGRKRIQNGVFDDFVEIKPYTIDEFRARVRELIKLSIFFKFSGGEPTLIPDLAKFLQIIKDEGGIVYLDTNATLPDRVIPLVKQRLVDSIGISLQGTDRAKALKVSGSKKPHMVWENPLSLIKEVLLLDPKLIIPVTLTVFDDVTLSEICDFADVLEGVDVDARLRLKINNFTPTRLGNDDLRPADQETLASIIQQLLIARPHWIGRVTVVLHATSDGLDMLSQPSLHY